LQMYINHAAKQESRWIVMNANRSYMWMRLILVLGTAFLSQLVNAADVEAQFKYSDEWSLVSAPPPAGPYQPVNIDPRVPGPGTIPEVPLALPRLQAAQEMPAESQVEASPADGTFEQTSEQMMLEQSIGTAPQETRVMPPVPGYYKPIMPQTADSIAVEAVPQAAVSAQQEQPEELTLPMEQEAAVPATAGTSVQQTAVAQDTAAVSEDTAVTPPVPEDYETALPLTATGESRTPVQEAASAGETPGSTEESTQTSQSEPALLQPPVEEARDSRQMGLPAVATDAAEEQQMPQGYEESVLPTTASMPGMPAVEGGATAMQEQPVFQPSMPGYYERMPPPAAGRLTREPPAGPATQLRALPSERYPAAGYPGYGYYGRPMPAAPGYSYPAPARYPYQSGMPGNWGMPSYGYPRGQEQWPEEDNVPPPPVYDSMEYPGRQGRVPR
jgi:hypothetical protein